MRGKLAQGSVIIELLVIGTILIGVAATSYIVKRGEEAEESRALTACEAEGGRCCPSTNSCSGSTSGLTCSTGYKCCFGSCIAPVTPTPTPGECTGTCIPDGEKDSCDTLGSGTCPLHKVCCKTLKPDPTPQPTDYPGQRCENNYAGRCVDNTLICSPSTIYSADCPSGTKCVPEAASCTAQTKLPCPSGFKVTCAADGKSVTIDWNNLTGAVGYMTRINKAPFSDWVGPGDFSRETTASKVTTNISTSIDYKYDVQGKVSGESYPFAGARCPFAVFRCNPQPCAGTCIPDGEIDTCQTPGIGTCSSGKYCCQTFNPDPTPTPTPYAGQKCENDYAGRCVSKSLSCSPSTVYQADCASGKKCVPEAAKCVVPTPTSTPTPTPTPTPVKPDLSVTGLLVSPSPPSHGERLAFASITVKNIGTVGVNQSLQFRVSIKDTTKSVYTCHRTDDFTVNLSPGYPGVYIFRTGLSTCPTFEAGRSYRVITEVDSSDKLNETKEGNNTKSTSFTVSDIVPTPTPGQCTGTCIPDGEKDSCQTPGTGTCPDYKYCCQTFKPEPSPTPTPYEGQLCKNTYAGKCVYEFLTCGPGDSIPADCPLGKKCVSETYSCGLPCGDSGYHGKCVAKHLSCIPDGKLSFLTCPDSQKCVEDYANCSNCTEENLLNCQFGCKPTFSGGECYTIPQDYPYCSDHNVFECQSSLPPQKCEPDLSGGHCVSIEESYTDCLVECINSGLSSTECGAVCKPYEIPRIEYCSESKIKHCSTLSDLYSSGLYCLPNESGGICVWLNSSSLENGEKCVSNYECKSRRCERPTNAYTGLCLAPIECKAGFTVLKSNQPGSCTQKCLDDGTEWITTQDCVPFSSTWQRYCQDDEMVVIENTQTKVLVGGEPCDNGCKYGVCLNNPTSQCIPGDISYVENTCSGIRGCQYPYSFIGECLAICNDSGNWQVANGCGQIELIKGPEDTGFSNEEKLNIMLVLSKFGLSVNYSHEGKKQNLRFLRWPLAWGGDNYSDAHCGSYHEGDMENDILAQVDIFDCRAPEDVYAHEIAHHYRYIYPDLFEDYKKIVGCKQNEISTEVYNLEKEGPVSWFGFKNCSEALAEAARTYLTSPCKMKNDYPIQYNWMKNNFYAGKEFCDPKVGYSEINSSLLSDNKQVKENVSKNITPNYSEVVERILSKFSSVSKVNAQSTSPYSGQFSIGSTRTEVLKELGTPLETTTKLGLTIVRYTSDSVGSPDTFIFNGQDELIYFRIGLSRLLSDYRNVSKWDSPYTPEGEVDSNFEHNTTRYIYATEGFSVVFKSSGDVLQYEQFIPISMEEYLDIWGVDIEPHKVKLVSFNQADANRDGKVDGFDYVIWWQNIGKNVAGGASQGDFDENGKVDGFDYVLWWQNFGT